jgi:RNA polymerase sigma factor (TIGR02999 family)
MSEVTQLLNAIRQGDQQASAELLPLVYEELRKLAAQKLAQEKPGQTLQATALVHEAYLRLVDGEESQQWNGRGHFFAAAAEAMRRLLVDQARQKRSQRRGGEFQRIELSAIDPAVSAKSLDILALDEALQQLSAKDARAADGLSSAGPARVLRNGLRSRKFG